MDHGAAGKVHRTHVEEQTTTDGRGFASRIENGLACRVNSWRRDAPNHVGNREINEGHPKQDEHQKRGKLDALGEGTDDQRGGDDGKGHLEHGKDVFRDRAAQRGLVHASEEGLIEPPPVGRQAGTEGHRVAVEHPNHHHHRSNQRTLHQHRQHVLGAHKAAIEQCQTGQRHEQDQRARGHHPGGIAAVGDRRCGVSQRRQRGRRGKRGQAHYFLEV
ncbi:hypothetical protein GALL_515770 [mine drainage metagenome]|uniref:Uncharacterized protein n=1 Tax=mine drainage metagenome TaxID=410659 RepID=A0A1J5PH10_9ZZZZ